MHDELAERRRPLVAAPTVDHQQPADVPELRDGEVRRQGGLPALLQRAGRPLKHAAPRTSATRVRLRRPGLTLFPAALEGTGVAATGARGPCRNQAWKVASGHGTELWGVCGAGGDGTLNGARDA